MSRRLLLAASILGGLIVGCQPPTPAQPPSRPAAPVAPLAPPVPEPPSPARVYRQPGDVTPLWGKNYLVYGYDSPRSATEAAKLLDIDDAEGIEVMVKAGRIRVGTTNIKVRILEVAATNDAGTLYHVRSLDNASVWEKREPERVRRGEAFYVWEDARYDDAAGKKD